MTIGTKAESAGTSSKHTMRTDWGGSKVIRPPMPGYGADTGGEGL